MCILTWMTNAFPLWVLLASIAGLIYPPSFTWFKGPMITAGLGIIMLGMGVTLSLHDFQEVIKHPGRVLTGFMLQYTIMPLMGWTIAALFRLPAPLAAGVILVACCPGGTASNVIAYLAGADLPLSVCMTACSTLLAAVMTPLLSDWLIGSRIEVSAWGLFISTVQVVILPIAAGVIINRFFRKSIQKILPLAPFVAVLFITLIVGSVVGQGQELILKSGLQLAGAVFVLHSAGFLLGYAVSRVVNRNRIVARTVSIEVGMQNSGLGVVLAKQNFANASVAVPSAIASVFQSLIGSFLAAVWRSRKIPVSAETPLRDICPKIMKD